MNPQKTNQSAEVKGNKHPCITNPILTNPIFSAEKIRELRRSLLHLIFHDHFPTGNAPERTPYSLALPSSHQFYLTRGSHAQTTSPPNVCPADWNRSVDHHTQVFHRPKFSSHRQANPSLSQWQTFLHSIKTCFHAGHTSARMTKQKRIPEEIKLDLYIDIYEKNLLTN